MTPQDPPLAFVSKARALTPAVTAMYRKRGVDLALVEDLLAEIELEMAAGSGDVSTHMTIAQGVVDTLTEAARQARDAGPSALSVLIDAKADALERLAGLLQSLRSETAKAKPPAPKFPGLSVRFHATTRTSKTMPLPPKKPPHRWPSDLSEHVATSKSLHREHRVDALFAALLRSENDPALARLKQHVIDLRSGDMSAAVAYEDKLSREIYLRIGDTTDADRLARALGLQPREAI